MDAQSNDSIHTQSIDEVRVIAKSIPSVSKSSSPLQVITQADMERRGVLSVSDAVRQFSGVLVKDYGGLGGVKTVSVRGLGDQYTGVLYDGVAYSNAQSGAIDIGRFSLDNISFISLSIGQADDIFQSAKAFASASTLNIKTSKPNFGNKKYKGQASLMTGSWGLFNPSAFVAYEFSSSWAATLNVNWQRADGNYPFIFDNGQFEEHRKRNNSDIDALRTELNVYGNLKKAGTLQLKTSYYDSERGLPGSVISEKTDANERLWGDDFFAQANYENNFTSKFSLKGFAKYSSLYSRYEDKDIKYSKGFWSDEYTQSEYYTSASVLYNISSVMSASLAQDYAYNKLVSNFEGQQYPSRNTSLTALNLQAVTKRLTATGSILGTYIDENVKQGNRPANKQRLSPALSISYNPFNNGLRLRASYKDILRVPTFNEMYYFRIGNTGLRPEISKQYNIGTTFIKAISDKYTMLNVSVDGYVNKVKDKIAIFAAAPLAMTMINIDNVTIKGIDVSTSSQVDFSSRFKLFASAVYSYQSAKNDETNKQIPYTPEHSGSGTVSLENPWVNISYTLVASGKRYAQLDHTRASRLDPYYDQSISVNKTFSFEQVKFRLQGDLSNFSNKNYEIIKGYPMPGRSFRISARLIF